MNKFLVEGLAHPKSWNKWAFEYIKNVPSRQYFHSARLGRLKCFSPPDEFGWIAKREAYDDFGASKRQTSRVPAKIFFREEFSQKRIRERPILSSNTVEGQENVTFRIKIYITLLVVCRFWFPSSTMEPLLVGRNVLFYFSFCFIILRASSSWLLRECVQALIWNTSKTK